MQKIFLNITILLSSLLAIGQDQTMGLSKKTFFVGLEGRIHSVHENIQNVSNVDLDSRDYLYGVSLKAGFFPTDKLAFGLQLDQVKQATVAHRYDEIFYEAERTSIGLFAKGYIVDKALMELYVGIITPRFILHDEGSWSPIQKYRLSVGYSFFIGKRIAITPKVNLSETRDRPRGIDLPPDDISALSLSLELAMHW